MFDLTLPHHCYLCQVPIGCWRSQSGRCASANIVARRSMPRMAARSSVRVGAGINITSINQWGKGKQSSFLFCRYMVKCVYGHEFIWLVSGCLPQADSFFEKFIKYRALLTNIIHETYQSTADMKATLKNAGSMIFILPDEGISPRELLSSPEKCKRFWKRCWSVSLYANWLRRLRAAARQSWYDFESSLYLWDYHVRWYAAVCWHLWKS